VPDGGDNGRWRHFDHDAFAALYRKNGWPSDFDGDAFEVDVARWTAVEDAKYHAEAPLMEVEKFELWARFDEDAEARLRRKLTEAHSEDEPWLTRFELWMKKESNLRNAHDLQKAREEAVRLCPGGVCLKEEDVILWELEYLRQGAKEKHNDVWTSREWEEESKTSNPEWERGYNNAACRAEKETVTYDKALAVAEADAQRLRPSVDFAAVTGMESLDNNDIEGDIARDKEWMLRFGREIDSVKEWALRILMGLSKAHAAVDYDVDRLEQMKARTQWRLEQREKWFAENGNEH